jgi:polyvinyl alcohol dehydrogenase (cytochrome)
VIAALPQERIVASLETGLMRVQGETLTPVERRAVASYLSPIVATSADTPAAPRCASASPTVGGPSDWTSWGVSLANERFQRAPGFTVDQVPALKLKWAFGFEGEANAAANPTVWGNRVFVGSASGRVYSLGADDGCLAWTFKAEGGVRAAVVIGPGTPGARTPTAYVSDVRATVYALDVATGALKWSRKIEEHRAARIAGSPVLYEGRLFVPISSGEEGIGAQPGYECCTFRGSLAALDADTGAVVWHTYVIPEVPVPRGKNARGVTIWGPSGAAIWSSPTIDPRTNTVYAATGDSYSQPAAPTSDSIVAFDLTTGAIKWVYQATAGDAFTMACVGADTTNCPDKAGPDHDFGQPPILLTLPGGGRVLLAGQKSGVVHALDPDHEGRKLWERRIGRGGIIGGIEWGSASDGTQMLVPLSDLTFKDPRTRVPDAAQGGGMFALDAADGAVVWTTRVNACGERLACSPSMTAPSAVVPGAVFAGSMDGHFRAFATSDGKVLWDFDTARDFATVNGVRARGGSIDVGGPAIANGLVVTTSGYGNWGGMRGNVLLAFSVEGR